MASSEVEGWFGDEVYSRRMFAATAWAAALHSLVLLAALFSLSLIQVRTLSPVPGTEFLMRILFQARSRFLGSYTKKETFSFAGPS
jgi:hypothetical protein